MDSIGTSSAKKNDGPRPDSLGLDEDFRLLTVSLDQNFIWNFHTRKIAVPKGCM